MKRQVILGLLFLNLLICPSGTLCAVVSLQEDSTPPTYVGWIEEIRGPAYLKRSAEGTGLGKPKGNCV